MDYKWQDDSKKLVYTNRKQISFDIDTKVAYKILGENYNNIYGYIRDYLKSNGFKHIQGSVYQSIEPLKTARVIVHLDELVSTYPYLEKCIRDINVTEILEVSNLNYLLSYDGTPGRYEGQYIQSRVVDDEFER